MSYSSPTVLLVEVVNDQFATLRVLPDSISIQIERFYREHRITSNSQDKLIELVRERLDKLSKIESSSTKRHHVDSEQNKHARMIKAGVLRVIRLKEYVPHEDKVYSSSSPKREGSRSRSSSKMLVEAKSSSVQLSLIKSRPPSVRNNGESNDCMTMDHAIEYGKTKSKVDDKLENEQNVSHEDGDEDETALNALMDEFEIESLRRHSMTSRRSTLKEASIDSQYSWAEHQATSSRCTPSGRAFFKAVILLTCALAENVRINPNAAHLEIDRSSARHKKRIDLPWDLISGQQQFNGAQVTTYSSRWFSAVRSTCGYSLRHICNSLQMGIQHMRVLEQRDGDECFLFTRDRKLVITRISKRQSKFLNKIIAPYVEHIVNKHPESLLVRLLGSFKVTIDSHSAPIYLIVTNNVLHAPMRVIRRRVELSGTSQGRNSCPSEKTGACPLLRDADFEGNKLFVGERKNEVLQAIAHDTQLLARLGCSKYKLQVGMVIAPKEHVASDATGVALLFPGGLKRCHRVAYAADYDVDGRSTISQVSQYFLADELGTLENDATRRQQFAFQRRNHFASYAQPSDSKWYVIGLTSILQTWTIADKLQSVLPGYHRKSQAASLEPKFYGWRLFDCASKFIKRTANEHPLRDSILNRKRT